MGDDVKSEAEWCQAALGKVLDAMAKKIRICTYSKSWCNVGIKEKRSQLGRVKRRRHRSAVTAQAKAKLQKSIQRAKDRMWNDCLNNLQGAEVWRAAKFTNPWTGVTMQALTDRVGKHANTITKKEEMLR